MGSSRLLDSKTPQEIPVFVSHRIDVDISLNFTHFDVPHGIRMHIFEVRTYACDLYVRSVPHQTLSVK